MMKAKKRPQPKFEDCLTCRFYNPAVKNPTCAACGAGEFYTARVNTKQPSDNQLMHDYRDFFDE